MTDFKEPENWYSPEEMAAYLTAEKKQKERDEWVADHSIITGEERGPRSKNVDRQPKPKDNRDPNGPGPGEKGYRRKIL